jgi:hypothetical protein
VLFLTTYQVAARRFSRAVWVSALFCVLSTCFAQVALAQDSNWEPKWDNNLREKWFKDDKTDPKKPTHRLAPTTCDDCQKIADQLQAVLDDWYVLQYAEGEAIRKDGLNKQDGDRQKAGNTCKDNAMAGLGQPDTKGFKAKQEKQKQDAKSDPKKFGDRKALAAELERLKKLLDDCLEQCNKPATDGGGTKKPETPTPTPTPQPANDGGKNANAPPVFDIQIPPLPPCFDSEKDRQAHRDKLDELQKKLTTVKKKYGVEFAEPPDNAWKEFKEKWENAIKEINDQTTPGADGKDKIDKVAVPCPKGGGSGPAKGKTPTPGKPKRAQRTTTGHNVSFDDGGGGPSEDFCALISENKIKIDDTFGTGETIGHVADLVIENLTDQPIEFTIPPMILESGGGKNQNYACPQGESVTLNPHESKTIPLNGVCLNRNKPPVGKGVGGDLMINVGGDNCGSDRHFKPKDVDNLLRICTAKYDAVDKLQRDGALKDLPYHDKQKQKDICLQWSMWSDRRVCELTGAPPATKDDLKKVVYKQVEEHGSVSPDKKKKIDEGIDTIFEKIELTNQKAKDLEKPEEETTSGDESTTEETPPVIQSEYISQTHAKQPTPTPTPKQKSGGKTKEKPTPTPTPVPKGKVPETKTKPTPTPTPTPEPYKDPPDKERPPKASYPYTKTIDCGTITITVDNKGVIIFDFVPNGKCPCKEFGWVQHFRTLGDDEHPRWHYDNGTQPSVSTGGGGQGAISHPDKPTQPTTKPADTDWNDWDENPYYGGAPSDEEQQNGFAKHPKPQTKIGDKPTHPNTIYRTQLVCIDTGEVLFTWSWGPFDQGNENPGKTGGGEIEPPPKKK